jgi:hypothetical protein
MKNLTILTVLSLSISMGISCGANKKNPIKNSVVDLPKDTIKTKNANVDFNPSFYLWIDEVHCGSSWHDDATNEDKIFRIVEYSIEEDSRTVIETIAIVGESELKLIKQIKLNGEILHMPNDPMPKLKFLEWINSKEAKFQLNNDSCKILNLETVSFRQCK